jgi:hypothetical protein
MGMILPECQGGNMQALFIAFANQRDGRRLAREVSGNAGLKGSV